jgi:flagellar biosynthesis protein FliP
MLAAVASLAVTLGVLFLALHFLRRLQGGTAPRGRRVPLSILQRVSTGHRQGIALVRCGERVLVVSVADGGARMLTELSGDDLTQALAPEPAIAPELATFPLRAHRPFTMGATAPRFRLPLVGRLIGLMLLLVVPLRVAAQTPPTQTPATQTPAQTPATQPALRLPATGATTAAPAPATAAAPAPAAPVVQGPALRGPVVTPPTPPKIDFQIGEGKDGLHLSGTVGLVVFMGAMTLLPAIFLLMTSFTRILIVLHFLRSAIGTQTAPPSQLLVAIAVLLTGVVMNPVLQQSNKDAIQPYLNGQITQAQAYTLGVHPLREFMLANTRDQDLAMFTELSHVEDAKSFDDLPIVTVVSAFVTSELRTSFQMGFVIYLPFIVVDLIVASVLMSMGMFMLPPVMISLPFKLLLFVLADGWTLVVKNLVMSFKV